MKHGMASNGNFLSIRNGISEISAVSASGMLDRTRPAAFPSDYRGRARIELPFCPEDSRSNKSPKRDNRSARVLTTSKLVGIPSAKDCYPGKALNREAPTDIRNKSLREHGWTFAAE
jgi:hypothetical protein